MKKYINFLKESVSILNKEYTQKIFEVFEKNGYGTYKINLSNRKLPLSNILITFRKNRGKTYSYFNSINSKIVDMYGVDVLDNCELVFLNFIDLKKEISHEINHIQEYYDKLDKKSTHDILNMSIRKLRNKNQDFDVFLDIIYNTTDNELNAKIPELYHYLKKFNTTDITELKDELEMCDTYSKIKEISDLDFKKLSNHLIDVIGSDKLIDYINEFNKMYIEKLKKEKTRNIKTYNFLKYTVVDIQEYFLKWEKIIKDKFLKWFKKVNNMIGQISLDIKSNHIIEEYDFTIDWNKINESSNKYLRNKKLKRII